MVMLDTGEMTKMDMCLLMRYMHAGLNPISMTTTLCMGSPWQQVVAMSDLCQTSPHHDSSVCISNAIGKREMRVAQG